MNKSLSKIRVLDLSRILAAPWAAQMLGDLGADVIKVERPRVGDDSRRFGPPFLQDAEGKNTLDSAFYISANRNKRSITIDLSKPEAKEGEEPEPRKPQVFINPEIAAKAGEQVYQEGCLSVPGIFADVTRANEITVRYLDRQGQAQELQADGLLAVCIQHEMDHLDGKLFVDYLSPLKREMVRKKLAKQRKQAAA